MKHAPGTVLFTPEGVQLFVAPGTKVPEVQVIEVKPRGLVTTRYLPGPAGSAEAISPPSPPSPPASPEPQAAPQAVSQATPTRHRGKCPLCGANVEYLSTDVLTERRPTNSWHYVRCPRPRCTGQIPAALPPP